MSLDALFKRYFSAVLLVLIAVAAYFQATGITQIVGSTLAVDENALASSGPLPARASSISTAAASEHSTSALRVIERNPFDSVKGNLNPPLDTAESATPALPTTEEPYSAPACDGVKVIATAVSHEAPWSFALLTGGSGESTGSKLRRQGDDYAGKNIWFVRWDRVWLIGPGTFCQAEMFPHAGSKEVSAAAPAASSSAASAKPGVSSTGGAPSLSAEIASKIQRVSANEFNVDRAVVDKILENQADLMRSARIIPETENGKTVGIRLLGVRPDTLLGVLGLENGDRLEKINGFDMASPEKALEAYARLRTADHLTVSVTRQGKPTNIDFNIK